MKKYSIFLLLIIFNLISEARDGVYWTSKLGYQYFKTRNSSDTKSIEGPLVIVESLLFRKRQSYFSSVFEASKGVSSFRIGGIERKAFINHYGVGLKWNFGPTDYDYPEAVDYAYVLNQGSLYLKACLTFTEPNNDAIDYVPLNSATSKYSSQYGLGYEVLGNRLGLFAEYSYSMSDYIDAGLLRGGINWRF